MLVTLGIIVPDVTDINHLKQNVLYSQFEDIEVGRACQKEAVHIMESQEAEKEEMGTLSWPSSPLSRSPALRMVTPTFRTDLFVLDSPHWGPSEVYLQVWLTNVLSSSKASQADCDD